MTKETETRKCIVCGEIREKRELLRFVATPDNRIVPDLLKKLPGKGVYVSNSYKCVTQAAAKNLFSKALKKTVKIDAGLPETVENILHKSALDAISLARKAGEAVIGFDKVAEKLKAGAVAFVLEASDAGHDGNKKIQHLATDVPVFRLYSVEELDQALNKVNTVYLAFLKGKMSEMVKEKFEKFADFLKDKNL